MFMAAAWLRLDDPCLWELWNVCSAGCTTPIVCPTAGNSVPTLATLVDAVWMVATAFFLEDADEVGDDDDAETIAAPGTVPDTTGVATVGVDTMGGVVMVGAITGVAVAGCGSPSGSATVPVFGGQISPMIPMEWVVIGVLCFAGSDIIAGFPAELLIPLVPFPAMIAAAAAAVDTDLGNPFCCCCDGVCCKESCGCCV